MKGVRTAAIGVSLTLHGSLLLLLLHLPQAPQRPPSAVSPAVSLIDLPPVSADPVLAVPAEAQATPETGMSASVGQPATLAPAVAPEAVRVDAAPVVVDAAPATAVAIGTPPTVPASPAPESVSGRLDEAGPGRPPPEDAATAFITAAPLAAPLDMAVVGPPPAEARPSAPPAATDAVPEAGPASIAPTLPVAPINVGTVADAEPEAASPVPEGVSGRLDEAGPARPPPDEVAAASIAALPLATPLDTAVTGPPPTEPRPSAAAASTDAVPEAGPASIAPTAVDRPAGTTTSPVAPVDAETATGASPETASPVKSEDAVASAVPVAPVTTPDAAPGTAAAPVAIARLEDSPPVSAAVEQPESPQADASAALAARARVLAFVTRFDGGPCVFVSPLRIAASSADIDGLARSKAPFETFNTGFVATLGFEPTVVGHVIWSPQCPAVDFLRHTARGASPPLITLDRTDLASGETLRGSITGVAGRSIALFDVMQDGRLLDLSGGVRMAGDSAAFDVPAPLVPAGGRYPQMLVAIASKGPLDVPALGGGAAATVFAALTEQAETRGLDLEAAAGSFLLRR